MEERGVRSPKLFAETISSPPKGDTVFSRRSYTKTWAVFNVFSIQFNWSVGGVAMKLAKQKNIQFVDTHVCHNK